MKITFLGHQGWLLEYKSTKILVDHILTDSLGTCEYARFYITPSRKIIKMPDIDAILITNERLDHFHIPSLENISRKVPIYIGYMMPECVKSTIRKLGFSCMEIDHNHDVWINDLQVSFHIGDRSVPLWEKRVYSVFAFNDHSSCLIQSDTMFSQDCIKAVNNCNLPTTVIVSNNSKESGAFDNMLPIVDDDSLPLEILEKLLVRNISPFKNIKNVLISGAGYQYCRQDKSLFSAEINPLLDKLSLGIKAMYLLPGEVLDDVNQQVSSIDWIEKTMQEFPEKNPEIPIFQKDNR